MGLPHLTDPVLRTVALRTLVYDPTLRLTARDLLAYLDEVQDEEEQDETKQDETAVPSSTTPTSPEASMTLTDLTDTTPSPCSSSSLHATARIEVIDWMHGANYGLLRMTQWTLHLAVASLDAWWSSAPALEPKIVHGAAALMVAAKLNEREIWTVDEVLQVCDAACLDRSELLESELQLLHATGGHLWRLTAVSVLGHNTPPGLSTMDSSPCPLPPPVGGDEHEGEHHSSVCPVCLEALDVRIRTMAPCGHSLCLECLLSLRQRRCPLCRHDLRSYFPVASPPPPPPVMLPLTVHIVPDPPPPQDEMWNVMRWRAMRRFAQVPRRSSPLVRYAASPPPTFR